VFIKPIPGFPGYFATACGKILGKKFQALKSWPVKKGRKYKVVGLYVGGGRRRVLVHRLIAAAFTGFEVETTQVHHLDFNPANNRIENLQILTPRENGIIRDLGLDPNYEAHKRAPF